MGTEKAITQTGKNLIAMGGKHKVGEVPGGEYALTFTGGTPNHFVLARSIGYAYEWQLVPVDKLRAIAALLDSKEEGK